MTCYVQGRSRQKITSPAIPIPEKEPNPTRGTGSALKVTSGVATGLEVCLQ